MATLEVLYQFVQTGLGLLLYHGGSLDGSDGSLGLALGGFGERVDVVEDVCCFGDGESSSVNQAKV